MVTDRELSVMRSAAADLLEQTALVKRPVRTADSAGGWTETYTTVAAAMPCRVAVSSNAAQVFGQADRPAAAESYVLEAAYDADLETDDRVTVGSVEYRVEGLLRAHQWVLLTRALVSRLT